MLPHNVYISIQHARAKTECQAAAMLLLAGTSSDEDNMRTIVVLVLVLCGSEPCNSTERILCHSRALRQRYMNQSDVKPGNLPWWSIMVQTIAAQRDNMHSNNDVHQQHEKRLGNPKNERFQFSRIAKRAF